MLGKDKSSRTESEPIISPARPLSSEEKTVIGKQITIEGKVRGKEGLLIEGSVKGSIELAGHHLTVGLNGQVEADIQAENVTISGRVIGNVNALAKVSITKEADFNGEIHAKSISVEEGAFLKASIELEREPKKKALPFSKISDETPSKVNNEPSLFAGGAEKDK